MFDHYTLNLFRALSELPDFDAEDCRKTLSIAYIYSIKMKLNLVQDEYISITNFDELEEDQIEDVEEHFSQLNNTLYEDLYFKLRRLGDSLESLAEKPLSCEQYVPSDPPSMYRSRAHGTSHRLLPQMPVGVSQTHTYCTTA